jgi:hypothetical protein
MTENDIRGYVSALEAAIKADREDVASAAALALLAGFLVDVNRIANALEGSARTLAQAQARDYLRTPLRR